MNDYTELSALWQKRQVLNARIICAGRKTFTYGTKVFFSEQLMVRAVETGKDYTINYSDILDCFKI